MSDTFVLLLKKNLVILNEGEDIILANSDGTTNRIIAPSIAQQVILDHLKKGGFTKDQLLNIALNEDPDADLARLYYLILFLEEKRWLSYTLVSGGERLVTLEPFSGSLLLRHQPIQGKFRLSRFACMRRLEDEIVLESPLGFGKLILHQAQASALVAQLVKPHSPLDLTNFSHMQLKEMEDFFHLLLSIGAINPCDEQGLSLEDKNPSLCQWELHDVFFHTRTRVGRHDNTLGPSYSFFGKISPLSGWKESMSEEQIALARPSADAIKAMSIDFFSVLDMRRSLREQGREPISLRQLGLFLYYTGRIQEKMPADHEKGFYYEASLRPCASGGAIHEIEYYLTISRCQDISPGFYHYNPKKHALEFLKPLGAYHKLLLADAKMAIGNNDFDLLITLAARFQRIAWKYQSIAYALIQKNVGSIYQQMYLVATALNISPCAIGAGNSDHFAQASGLDYWVEGSVGEFVLSGR